MVADVVVVVVVVGVGVVVARSVLRVCVGKVNISLCLYRYHDSCRNVNCHNHDQR